MYAAVNIGIVMFIVFIQAVNYGIGFLGSRSIIQVHQSFAMNLTIQNGKIFSDSLNVEHLFALFGKSMPNYWVPSYVVLTRFHRLLFQSEM